MNANTNVAQLGKNTEINVEEIKIKRAQDEEVLRAKAELERKPEEEREYTVYHHTLPSAQYVFKSGGVAEFIGGKFLTDDPVHIQELDAEVGRRNQFISKGAKKLKTSDLDPVAEIKRQAVEEYLASLKAASGDASRDMGTSTQDALIKSAANSRTVGEAAAGSSSGMVAPVAGVPADSIKIGSK